MTQNICAVCEISIVLVWKTRILNVALVNPF